MNTLLALLLLAVVGLSTIVDVVEAQSQQGYRSCMQAKDEFMSYTVTGGDINDDPQNHLLCECREQTTEAGQVEYMLLCSLYDSWEYCSPTPVDDGNNDAPMCASVLFGRMFDTTGQVTNRFRNYDYIEDRTGTLTVTRYLEPYPDRGTCVVAVNQVQCKRCEIIDTCPVQSQLNQQLYERGLPSSEELGLFTDLKVDCTNVNELATFECGVADGAGNVLHILNGTPILPEQLTRPPFMAPVLPVPAPTGDGAGAMTPPPSESQVITSETMAPTTSRVPTEEPTAEPTVSFAPTISSAPTAAPTVTGAPTSTGSPTTMPSEAPTEPVVNVAGTYDISSSASSVTVIPTTLFIVGASFFLFGQ